MDLPKFLKVGHNGSYMKSGGVKGRNVIIATHVK
jgi:hypothetical protein